MPPSRSDDQHEVTPATLADENTDQSPGDETDAPRHRDEENIAVPGQDLTSALAAALGNTTPSTESTSTESGESHAGWPPTPWPDEEQNPEWKG